MGLYVVRLYDTNYGWMDVTGPIPQDEADAIWSKKTHNGTQHTRYNHGDYYEIFPANTTMLLSSDDHWGEDDIYPSTKEEKSMPTKPAKPTKKTPETTVGALAIGPGAKATNYGYVSTNTSSDPVHVKSIKQKDGVTTIEAMGHKVQIKGPVTDLKVTTEGIFVNGLLHTSTEKINTKVHPMIQVIVQGDVANLTHEGHGEVLVEGSILGNVMCQSDITCLSIQGEEIHGENFQVKDVTGNIFAEGNVQVENHVTGDINTEGDSTVGPVTGNVTCSGDTTVKGDVEGNIQGDGSVTVEGSVAGPINTKDEVTVGGIVGDVDCGGLTVEGDLTSSEVNASDIHVNNNFKSDAVNCDDLDVGGAFTGNIMNAVDVGAMDVHGNINCEGDVTANHITGSVICKGDMTVTSINK